MNQKGRLVVEFAIAMGFSSMVLSASVHLLRQAHQRQIIFSAARLGTLLQSVRGASEEIARDQVLRILDENNLKQVQLSTGRYQDLASARFYRLVRTRIQSGSLMADIICEQEEQ